MFRKIALLLALLPSHSSMLSLLRPSHMRVGPHGHPRFRVAPSSIMVRRTTFSASENSEILGASSEEGKKRGRGRPRKIKVESIKEDPKPPKRRGRPPKLRPEFSSEEDDSKPPKRRGRPAGLKLSAEARQKIAESRRGKKWDENTRNKMAQSKVGRAHSQETIERMSQAHFGKRKTNSTRAKMSEARQGHVHSPEVKERIRQTLMATNRKKKLIAKKRGIVASVNEKGAMLDKAYEEMRNLRNQMDPWIRHYTKLYGRKPTLDGTRVEFPSLHKNMLRYNELLNLVKITAPPDDINLL
mmetsp:Transcript_5211/g.9561  ORF Transcript_5211/g.9561 Transcript_5211/m.9561 type:complete len:299 (-) Transcript_5211:173-1069(-)